MYTDILKLQIILNNTNLSTLKMPFIATVLFTPILSILKLAPFQLANLPNHDHIGTIPYLHYNYPKNTEYIELNKTRITMKYTATILKSTNF